MLLLPAIVATLALLPLQTPDATRQTNGASLAPTETAALEDQPDHVALRQRPDEVVCEMRPVTGSRFTRRVCATRRHAAVTQSESRRVHTEMTRGNAGDSSWLSGPRFGPE
jgi:hypothetical protein